jgi:anti-sigma-K factor RskA
MTMENKTPNISPCDELRELLPTYALGAASAEESRRVQELLPLCPDAETELREFAIIAVGLAKTTPHMSPPAGLEAKLMRAIQTPNAAARPVRPVRKFPVWQGLAVAALATLFLTNILLIWQLSNSQTQLQQLQQNQLELATVIQNPAVRLMGNNDTVQAVVYVDDSENRLWLASNALASLPTESTYQLWLIGDSVASVGVFGVQNGQAFIAFTPENPITDFSTLGISIEPQGGSEAPTTTPIAIGDL